MPSNMLERIAKLLNQAERSMPKCPACGAPAADWQGSITCQGPSCGWSDVIGYNVKRRPWLFIRKGEVWMGHA